MLLERVRQIYHENIQTLISRGEQENIEFKSSIRWDFAKKNVNTGFQKVIAKSITGMMNNTGGTLIIGVADNGKVIGIENDLKTLRKPTTDEFELVLIEFIQNNIGLEFIKHVDIEFEIFDEKEICIVSIEPSPKPVFLVLGNDF